MKAITLFAVLFLGVIAIGSLSMNEAYGAAFAKYDGIDGESKDEKHDKWIDVLSIDWGTTQTTDKKGNIVPKISDMTIVFEYEKASPKLVEKSLKGEIIPKLELELTATYGGARATYLKYELTNVMVTSYQVNASGNDEAGPPTVVVGNNFEEIKVTYTEFDDTGSNQGNTEVEYTKRPTRK